MLRATDRHPTSELMIGTPVPWSPIERFLRVSGGLDSGTGGGLTGTDFAVLLGMENKKTNQERGRKYGGSSSFVDRGQPSRAPRQDEQGEEAVGSTSRDVGPADGTSPKQGISNRPAKDEHAFPDSDRPDSQAVPDSVDDGPKQVGGNRGQV